MCNFVAFLPSAAFLSKLTFQNIFMDTICKMEADFTRALRFNLYGDIVHMKIYIRLRQ